MSNEFGNALNGAQAAEPPKDNPLERDRHLPTMPDPTRDRDDGVRVPTDKDPSNPLPIDEPQPIGDKDDTNGLEQIA
ncbi:MAG: hypothetical protein WAM89_16755 [Terriglobales bacterium]